MSDDSAIPSDLTFLLWLVQRCGYTHPRTIGGGRWAAIQRLAFTHRLAVGRIGDYTGIEDGWCYRTHDEARAALDAWDGQGEPAGWHRHPYSGRRVSQSPDERDDAGREVGAVGVMYRRG